MRATTALFLGFLLVGCDHPPSDDGLKEWTPADHDRKEETARLQAGVQASAEPKKPGDNSTLIELTWRQQCAQCHGLLGKGDGPNGPMVKAPDLTREEWQARMTDPEIAATIRAGKNQMPKFDLPPQVLAGIIARIRASRGH